VIGDLRKWRDPTPDALRILIVQGTVAAVALTWSLHFISFLDVKEAALWVGVVLLWVANTFAGIDSRPGFHALFPCWATLAVVVVVGYVSAPVPVFVASEVLRLLPILLMATLSFDLVQRPENQSRIISAVVCAGFIAALLALFQAAGALPTLFPAFVHYDQEMYSVFGNEGLLAGFIAIALTLLSGTTSGATGRRRACQFAIAGTLVATLLLTESRGGLAAALAGLGGLAILGVLSIRGAMLILCGLALIGAGLHLSLGLAPWEKWLELFSVGDTGGNLRRWVLAASTRLAAENPVLGCGLGHYAYAIPIWLGVGAPAGGVGANTLTTYHAHLDLLEWICETGVVGLLGAGWIASRLRFRSATALCGLVAALVFSMSHPAMYSAPHALAAFLLYVMSVKTSPAQPVPRSWRYPVPARALLCFVLVFGGSVAFVAMDLYPSFLLRQAEDRHLAGATASDEYLRAIGAWGFHPEAHEGYGIYAYEQGEFRLALEQFEQARQGLDTGRIHQLLAMASIRLGDRAGACHWYTQCAKRWPWDMHIQARLREYCGTGAGSGPGEGQ